ncbi:carbohydrate ABC transporter permease [Paenibacillus solisilvae]|uniref:Carbohydrate ABC transporter permease n=1 Tax=Paenibacillus solisilvae TaxID=2486751 RepID=A0ABW0W1U2_9BACL
MKTMAEHRHKSITAKRRAKRRSWNYMGLLYISPWLIGFLLFELYPFASSFIYSFTDLSLLRKPHFIGLDNFTNLFSNDPLFLKSLQVTFIFVLIAVPSKIIFSLLVALILNMKLKSINLFRTIYYLPSIMGGSVTVAILWRYLFSKEGLINVMLDRIHIPGVDWIGSPKYALFTISLLTVWQFGSSMVLFLAGLKQVPGELYEAGKIDGASRIRMFFSITLPLITPILFFNLIMQMVNAFQEFTGAMIITGGGPLNSTYLYGLLIYQNAFQFFKMGYASAQSWVLFIIILIFTFFTFKSSSSWVHYEDGGKN